MQKSKVFSAMNRCQKIISLIAICSILVCTLAATALGYELVSGHLDHAYDSDYRGQITITTLPDRLDAPEPTSISLNQLPATDPTVSFQLSFTYEELEDWLNQPQPGSNFPMVVAKRLYALGLNINDLRAEYTPEKSGSYYIYLDRSVVSDMRDILKGTDDSYAFKVSIKPIHFSAFELSLRNRLSSLSQRFGNTAERLTLSSCLFFLLIAFLVYRLWKAKIYEPVKCDLVLLSWDSQYLNHWD